MQTNRLLLPLLLYVVKTTSCPCLHGQVAEKTALRRWLVILLTMMSAWFTLHGHLFNGKRHTGRKRGVGGGCSSTSLLFFFTLRCSRSHCISAPFFSLSCARLLVARCSFCCRCCSSCLLSCCAFWAFGRGRDGDVQLMSVCSFKVYVWLFVGHCRFSLLSRLSGFCCSLASIRSRLSKPKINSMQYTQQISRLNTSHTLTPFRLFTLLGRHVRRRHSWSATRTS